MTRGRTGEASRNAQLSRPVRRLSVASRALLRRRKRVVDVIYVDNVQIPAAIKNGPVTHDTTWSHLTADSQDELHVFARRLGLKRSYFQPGTSYGGKPSVAWHYDV